jgi:hypothetical protein
MTTQRVYHPETCEPFDVPPLKAADLVLNKGWTNTPWTRVEPVVHIPATDQEPVRGRGRRRPAEVIETVEETPVVEHVEDEPASESWQG